MKEFKGYKCEFCSKLYQSKYHCEKHEILCYHNPRNNHQCFYCYYCTKETINVKNNNEYYQVDEFGTIAETINVKIYHCKKLNKNLYPVSVLRKKLNIRYPEHFANQILMPNDCEYFKLAIAKIL